MPDHPLPTASADADGAPPPAPTGLRQALALAAAVAGGQDFPRGCLYVVATPIGNLADIGLRALHALALADAIACEDTRTSGAFLRHFGIEKPLLALHEHNERAGAAQVCARLSAGERVAYVSDAGTPAVSDPGAVLVQAVAAAGHRVLPLPGASSAVVALSVAGDAQARGFVFAGFLSSKAQERAAELAAWRAEPRSVVIFEAPHRIEALAGALAQAFADDPGRRVTVCRELTKQFEQVETMPVAALPAWLAADARHRRGEFVLVLHAPPARAAQDDALPPAAERTLRVLLRELPVKQAAALAAELCDVPRKRLYAQALAWKDEAGADE
jgi:16S rRNA (cytidine1402-2'-O)-methyltransferase